MMIKNLIIHYILFLVTVVTIQAQDLHFSNFYNFSNYFNPANTGFDARDITIGFQQRSQWSKIPAAYKTFGVNVQKREKHFAWGGLFYKNGAGRASLQTTGGLITTSYYQQLAEGRNELAVGFGFGFLQQRFSPRALSFDAQYQPGLGYDISNSNGETFVQTNNSTMDISIGATWNGELNKEKPIKTQLGFALAHVQLPDMGFNQEIVELPMRVVVHGQLDFYLSPKNNLLPYFFYQKQGIHKELLIGARMKRQLKEHTFLRSGIAYRMNDAMVLQAGIEWGNKTLGLNYDLNNSRLSVVSQGQGAFELSFAIKLRNNAKKKDRDKDGIYDDLDKCPSVAGLKKYKGCPKPTEDAEEELDSDGDKVLDEDDECPFIPGYRHLYGCPDFDKDGVIDKDDGCPKLFGSIDNHGCPAEIKDTDRDGVPDSEDYCVFLWGLPKFHGCPDSDKDGLSDIDDECPYLKGLIASKGCPNDFKQGNNLRVILEFESNQYSIHPKYANELDFLIKELHEIDNYKIMIAGHADSEGNASFNYSLGQKRSFAVKKYLIKKGISHRKIKTISYGEARPKRNNHQVLGKAKNRRAEISIILE